MLTPCPDEVARAIAAVFGDRRSLAPYCWSWPDVVSRPFLFCRHARARSARTGNAVTVRAARGAQRRGSLWLPAGRGRFYPVSPVFDRRNETIASAQRFAAVKWSGRKAGESGQAAGGSVPIQTERRAELAQSLSERMMRLADAGLFLGGAIATGNQSTNFSCRPRAKINRQPEALDNPETIRQPTTPRSCAG